jgi:hypothetical protein
MYGLLVRFEICFFSFVSIAWLLRSPYLCIDKKTNKEEDHDRCKPVTMSHLFQVITSLQGTFDESSGSHQINIHWINQILLQDSRVANWFFVQSPMQPISVLVAYGLFVYFGDRLMANRNPFKLNTFLNIYNVLQVLASFYIFYEVCTG